MSLGLALDLSLSRYPKAAGGGGLDPLDLFTGSQAGFVFDMTSAANLATATDGTGSVTLGSAVARATDLTGQSHHASQSTSDKRPLFSASPHGVNGLQFDGTDDLMAVAGLIYDHANALADGVTVIGCVAVDPKLSSASGASALYTETNSGSSARYGVFATTGPSTGGQDGDTSSRPFAQARLSSGGQLLAKQTLADKSIRTIAIRISSVAGVRTQEMWIDGVKLADTAPNSGASLTTTHASIGAILYPSESSFLEGWIFHLMGINTKVADADIVEVQQWMANRARAGRSADGTGSNTKLPRVANLGGHPIISTVTTQHAIRLTDMSTASPFAGPAYSIYSYTGAGDNHSAAAILRMADGKLLAAWCEHDTANLYTRVASAADSIISWNAFNAQTTHGLATADYPSLAEMDGHIYVFLRGWKTSLGETIANENPWFSKLPTPLGATDDFPSATKMITGITNKRPYRMMRPFTANKLGFILSTDNPASSGDCSIYYVAFTASGGVEGLELADGTSVTMGESLTNIPKVYDSTIDSKKAWIRDIIPYGGHPALLYVIYDSLTGQGLQSIHYARYTGSTWVKTKICDVGPSYLTGTPIGNAGAVFDPENPDVVIISRSIDSGLTYQLWRYVTSDGGVTWSGSQITSETRGQGALDPVFLEGVSEPRLTYDYGTMTDYNAFDMTTVCINSVTGAA